MLKHKFLKNKKKLSRYRPGQALGVPGGWGSRISRQSAHEGGKIVSPTHRPSLPPRNDSWYSFVRGWVDPRAKMRPEGLSHWKIPVTPSGIEPATFRFVAQCLNHLHHRVPPSRWIQTVITFGIFTAVRSKHSASVLAVWVQNKVFKR
jgi:hypothetical protein